MIPEIRQKFNSEFSEENYYKYIREIWKWTNGNEDFRICETPLFIDRLLTKKLLEAVESITTYLQSEKFYTKSRSAVPQDFYVPNEESHPLFLQIDFAITKNKDDEYEPKLIELQGFPSLYAFQCELDIMNRKYFRIPEGFGSYFNQLDNNTYIDYFKHAVIKNHNPENVILLEIEPDKQKTRIDFYITEHLLGIKPVCITEVIKKGKKLFYRSESKLIEIDRIYNRVIFDELIKKKLHFNFDFRNELDIEWAGHPNWFFKISKHTLPQITGSFAPKAFYLDEIDHYPNDLENYVLKPLYSFAGSGVIVDLNKEILDHISDRKNYILQEKVEYAPLIKTPDGYSFAEIRMMLLWIDKPVLVNNLLRTSKGKMMGVDFNKGKTWVGSNIVYHQ
ncbi:MAG: hypothetical protein AB1521_11060 [Bacteroidota bacterium]